MPSIEQRVVEMKFDNKNFESNVHTTIDSLDNLKKSLALNEASKGLEDLQRAGDRFDLHGMEDAAGRVQNALAELASRGLQSIQGLSAKASAELSKMFNQMTIEPVTAGWSKYADKTQAIQTIMAATSKQWADESERMENVQEQLGVLNWFTDETSYKFLDMVQNIGKFTSAGVKLQPAVTAMQGISTWAAVSGANVNDAGRAMYNLSQAMATGAVKLMDWKSIENANMATIEFKETVIDTAEKMGELTKVGDHWVVKGTDMVVTAQNFNESLSKGWFTSEVLMKSLNKYGHASELIHELAEETDLAARDIVEMTESYRDGLLDIDEASEETGMSVEDLTAKLKVLASDEEALGLKAFKAAYETKTFQEAIDYVKESASSLWMQIYENIFGNYVETKKIWGALVDELYEIFLVPLEGVNDLLGSWHELGGFEDFWAAIGNLWQAVKNIARPIAEAWNLIFPPMLGYQLADLTKKFRDWSEGLTKAFGWTGSLKDTIAEPFFKIRDAEQKVAQAAAEVKAGLEDIANAAKEVIDPVKKTEEALANGIVDEVWAGKWGHGEERIKRMREAHIVYEMVQNAVNEGANCNKRYAVTEEAIAAASVGLAKEQEKVAETTEEITNKEIEARKEREKLTKGTTREKAKQILLDEEQRQAAEATVSAEEKREFIESKLSNNKKKALSIFREENEIREKNYEAQEKINNAELRAQNRVENLYKAAAGIFALVATIKDVLSEAGKMLIDVGAHIANKLQPAMDLVLDIAGKLGESMVYFYALNKQTNVIGATFKRVGNAIKSVVDGIFAGVNAFIKRIRYSKAWANLTAAWERLSAVLSELFNKVLKKIGDFFTNTNFERAGESFGDTLAGFAEIAIDKLAEALNWLVDHKDEIAAFFGIFTNGLGAAIEAVGKALKGVGDGIATGGIGGAISAFFGAIGEGFNKLIGGAGNILSNEKVQAFWNKISERLSNIDGGKVASTFATGAGGVLLLAFADFIKKIAGGFGDAVENIKKIPEKIVGVLDGLVGALQAYQMKLKADVLWTIAKAIGVLALALFGLSLIPKEELEGATAALVTVMGMLMGVMAVYTKMKGLNVDAKDNALATFLSGIQDAMKKAIKMAGMGVMMVGFGVAVVALIGALLLLSKIDWKTFGSNIGKLLAIVVVLDLSMVILANLARRMPKGMGGALVGFAVSVIAMAGAMMLIAKIPADQLWSVTGALAAVIGAMAVFAFAMSFSKNGRAFIGFGIGILAIAAALAVLTVPLVILSAIPWDNLKHAADILGGLLLALVAAAVIMKVFQTSGKALINLALALVVLGGALALVGVLALPAALGLGIIAGAIVLLIGATLLLGGLAPMLEVVVASIYALAAASLKFALAGLALSAALLVLGIALPTLANGLVAFGEQLKKHGLEIALAVGFIILTVVAAIGAASVVKAITGTAVTWIKALAEGFTKALPVLLNHLALTITTVLLFLAAAMPGIVDKLLELLESIINSLAAGIQKHGPALMNAVLNLVISICQGILGTLWSWIEPWVGPIVSFLSSVWNVVWGWIGPVVKLVGGVIVVVYDFVKIVVEAISSGFGWLFGKVSEFFDWLHEKFGWLSDGLDWVGDKIGGLFGGASEEVETAASEIPQAAANGLAKNSEFLHEQAQNMYDNMTARLDTKLGKQHAEEDATDYTQTFADTVKNANIEKPNFEEWSLQNGIQLEGFGGDNAGDYLTGLTDTFGTDTSVSTSVEELMGKVGSTGETESKTQGSGTGENFNLGILSGLDLHTGPIYAKVKEIARGMKGAANEELDSHSPSREAEKIAKFFDMGLVRGLDKNTPYVEKSTRNVARRMLECIGTLSDDVDSMFEDGINTNPVISPVLDLENLQNGVHGIDDLFGSTSFAMSGSMGVRSQSDLMEMRMNRLFQQHIEGMADRITDAENDRAYEFTIPVEIDGRQVAKATAVYSNEELNRLTRRANRKAGIV